MKVVKIGSVSFGRIEYPNEQKTTRENIRSIFIFIIYYYLIDNIFLMYNNIKWIIKWTTLFANYMNSLWISSVWGTTVKTIESFVLSVANRGTQKLITQFPWKYIFAAKYINSDACLHQSFLRSNNRCLNKRRSCQELWTVWKGGWKSISDQPKKI